MNAVEKNQFKDRENMWHRFWLRSIKLINAILITIPFYVCWYQYYADRLYTPFYAKGDMLVVFLFLALYITFGRIYAGFTISLHRISELVYSQVLAILFTNSIIYVVTWLLTRFIPNPIPLLISVLIEGLLSAFWSAAAHKVYFHKYEPIRSAVIWDMRKGLEELVESYGLDKRFDIVSTPNVWEVFKEPDRYLNDVGAVFLCGIHSHERNQIM